MLRRLFTYTAFCILLSVSVQAKHAKDIKESFNGIDVSWYQKKIDWDATARDKRITFAFIKATEGGRIKDANYRYNIENARRKGIKVGSYHFLRPETPVRQQFDNFISRVKKHEQDLIPVIDIEDMPEIGVRWKPQQARDMLKQMADMIEKHYGCKPMIYTSNKFFTDYLGRAFAGYHLFIARYGNVEPEPMNGVTWTLWQFTKAGRVDGIDHAVDLSRFNKGHSLASIAMHKHKGKEKSSSRHPKKRKSKHSNHHKLHKDKATGKKQSASKSSSKSIHNKTDKSNVNNKVAGKNDKKKASTSKSKKHSTPNSKTPKSGKKKK